MRKLTDIESQIDDFQKQLDALTAQKSDAEAALEDARRRYSKSIVSTESTEQNDAHRKEVTKLTIDADALAGAVDLVTGDLEKAQNEKAIILLFQTDGKRHNDSMAEVEKNVGTINNSLPKLTSLVGELTDAIKRAVSGTERGCSSLKFISDNLDPGLSLESFLNGDMEPADGEDRTGLLDNIGEDLRDSISSLVVPENIPLAELETLIESMIRWRALVSSFQDGSVLIENRKRLFAPVGKKPSTQRITVPKIPHSKTEPEIKRPPVPKFNRNKVVEDHNRRALA